MSTFMQAAQAAGILAAENDRCFVLDTNLFGFLYIRRENIGRLEELAEEFECAQGLLWLMAKRDDLDRFEAGEINQVTWSRTASVVNAPAHKTMQMSEWLAMEKIGIAD